MRRLDEALLSKEQEELMKERWVLEDLLESQSLQWKALNEMILLKKKFADYELSGRQTLVEPEEEVTALFQEDTIDDIQ